MKIVFIGYNYLPDYLTPKEFIDKIKSSAGIMEALAKMHSVIYVGQIGYEGEYSSNGVDYYFFNPKRPGYLVRSLHQFVKQLIPDVVIVPGFHFPLQVIQLKLYLPKSVKIILEHHGDLVPGVLRRFLQRLADHYVDAYTFTAIGNSVDWISYGVIKDAGKCFEVLEASTMLKQGNKTVCKAALGMIGNANFLWVGRLNENKDPLFVLAAFCRYHEINAGARLYMIYQEDDMLDKVKSFIESNQLNTSVVLKGKVLHDQIATWFSAADIYISASKHEGSGYALIEAMSCGCIPVVTAIPSFNKITAGGEYGFIYHPGDIISVDQAIAKAVDSTSSELPGKIKKHFLQELSFDKIAEDLNSVIVKINS